jgi:hypothetical protein
MQEIHKLESILSKMPALEQSSRELAKAADAVFEPLAAKVGILAAHDDPNYLKVNNQQFAVWRGILDCWEEVRNWVDANASSYAGMDASLKKLKERINKKKVLDYIKTQKSLPDAKYTYEAGIAANQLFKDALNDAVADLKDIPVLRSGLAKAMNAMTASQAAATAQTKKR